MADIDPRRRAPGRRRRAARLAPALAPPARRVGGLRRPPPGPHVPAAAGVQSARARDDPEHADRGPRRRLARSPCSRTCSRRCRLHAPRRRDQIVDTPRAAARDRGRRLHPGPGRRRSASCRRARIELVVDVWADRTPRSARRTTSPTSSRSRTAASRSASRCRTRTARSTPIPFVPPIVARETRAACARTYARPRPRACVADLLAERARRGRAHALRQRARRGVGPGLRALVLRGLDRAAPPRADARQLDARGAR